MSDQYGLKQYIKEAKTQGMSRQDIARELAQSGWHVHDLIDVIADVEPETTGRPIIMVRDLSKHYGKVKALDAVSFDVPGGTVTALLGPNGAGKTTLVKILTTLVTPTAGNVNVAGLDVIHDAQKLRSIIGLAGQYASVDEFMTGRENLEIVGRLYHLSPEDATARADELLHQFNLEEAADRILKTYSGGMRRRLDLAASLVIKPKILFLDEPTAGLDPSGRFGLWKIIRDLVAEGTTVLLTTQYLEEADQLAHKIFVIDRGHIIAQGTPDELKNEIGGDVLELHIADHGQAIKAAEIARQFGSGEPHADTYSGIVTMPVSRGASVLVDVIRQFDEARLRLADVILRRPSLDDVFLKLTGHIAQ